MALAMEKEPQGWERDELNLAAPTWTRHWCLLPRPGDGYEA
jgi:hypothetical protein